MKNLKAKFSKFSIPTEKSSNILGGIAQSSAVLLGPKKDVVCGHDDGTTRRFYTYEGASTYCEGTPSCTGCF